MAIVTLNNIEKTFGRRVIFDKLEFSMDRGERVGLIGDNGTGKTTLFKVIAGQMPIDVGTVAIAKGVKLGYLTQDPVFEDDNTVIDEAELAFAELHTLSHQMRDLEHEMAHVLGDALEKILEKYQDVQHKFDIAGGYAWQHRLEATLLGVGLDRGTWEQKVHTLSGGQRSRLALAKLLINQSEVLLLDEPTNHLDLGAIAWLEEYLSTFAGAVLLISHDRYLLDRIATRIVWLTGSKLKNYPGNYSAFVQQRELQELSQQRAYEEQREDIEKQSEFIRRFGAGQRSKEAKGRKKRLDRLLVSDSLLQAVETSQKIRVNLSTDQRAGDRVLSVKELSKSYDTNVLWKEIGAELSRGERVGIIGPNGAGKTTFLEVLLGKREADGGDIRWGANLKIGYYDQSLAEFDPENTVAEETRGDRDVTDKEIRAVLATMLFQKEAIEKPMSALSGGERARVALAQLLLDKPNVLVMDEPTNHLDINSCEALERALRDFQGTIICVSHDRYFLDKSVERLLVLDPPNMTSFDGSYTAWMKKKAALATAAAEVTKGRDKEKEREKDREREKEKVREGRSSQNQSRSSQSSQASQKDGSQKKKDNPYSRPFGRLGLDELEREIQKTEESVLDCQNQYATPEVTRDASKAKKLNEELANLSKKLKQLEEEYFKRNE